MSSDTPASQMQDFLHIIFLEVYHSSLYHAFLGNLFGGKEQAMPNVAESRAPLYKASPDAWQTKVQVAMVLPFPFPWLIVGAILFAIGAALIVSSSPPDKLNALFLLGIKAALIAAIANSVVFFERLLDDVADTFPSLLDEQEDTAKAWAFKWYQNIFWSKRNVVAGFLLGCICVLFGPCQDAALFTADRNEVYSYIIIFIIGFLGGSMFWTMLGIARMTSSLGRDVHIKPSIFDSKTSVLRTASSVLWKVALTASLVYLLGVSIYYFSPDNKTKPLELIIAIFGVFIFLYFILPQVNIHRTLVTIKRTRLGALVRQIDNTFDNVAAEPTPENINQLRDLFHLQDIVNGKKAWSFGTGELLMLLGSVLLPLLFFVIQYLLTGPLTAP